MKCALSGIAIAAAAAVVMIPSASARAEVLAPSFEDTIAIGGLATPVAVSFGANGDVFVAEKAGLVKKFDPLPSPGPGTVILDIRAQVANNGDRGMVGLAVHPAYPLAPYVYVMYTVDAPPGQAAPVWNDDCGQPGQPDPVNPGGGCVATGRLVRYSLVGNALVDETVLIDGAWYQQYRSHTVDDLVFGPDGNLYVSAGDGASFLQWDDGSASWVNTTYPNPDDPLGEGGMFRAQDLLTSGDPVGFSGTVLRLDPMTGAAATGNPLSGDAAPIIAFGLRNPFRMAFQPSNGALWIGDVGFTLVEELNRIRDPADGEVENFGWPCTEGTLTGHDPFSTRASCQQLLTGNLPAGTPGRLTYPEFSYRHGLGPGYDLPVEPCKNGASNAIAGLAFYGGTSYPARLHGALFITDYSSRCLFALPLGASGDPDPTRLEVIASGLQDPASIETGPDNDLYYVSVTGGAVRHVRYTGHAPTAIATASATSGMAPLAVTFDGSTSMSPDNEPLIYTWDLDNDGAFDDATGATAAITYAGGVHRARLRVEDANGEWNVSQPIVIAVDAAAPHATILSPSSTLRFASGQIVEVSGRGDDLEAGVLPGSSLHWQITLLHCPGGGCHAHPSTSFDGETGSFVAVPDGYPSKYSITLTVTDPTGLTDTATITIDARPELVADALGQTGAEPLPDQRETDTGCSSTRRPADLVLVVLALVATSRRRRARR